MATNSEITICGCCGQPIRIWKKAIISTAAASLCRLVAMFKGDPIHHDKFTVLAKDRNFSQLVLWDLVRSAGKADPKKRKPGMWIPTWYGIDFVNGAAVVPKFVITRNNEVIRFEGPPIGIEEALGDRFDYSELMGVNRLPWVHIDMAGGWSRDVIQKRG